MYCKNIKMEKISFKSLSREIKVSPKSLLTIETLPDNTKVGTVEIGIGKGRSKLILDEESLKALTSGGSVKITTAKEFRQKVK